MGIKIISAGKYLPERVVTNDDFAKMVDTSDEWITTRTGIKTRHVATGELNWEMGVKAAREALNNASLSPDEIDLVIASTCTPDYLTPSMACLIANGLGMKSPACIEINCACAGYVSALDIAARYLNDGDYRTALIVSSEMLTKITDYTDRATCVLFGDGAGATVVQKGDGLYVNVMGSDPSGGCHLFARGVPPSNQFRTSPFDPLSDGFAPTNGAGLHQDGQDVYKFATRAMPQAVKAACMKANILPDELDLVIPHQANYRIIETAAKNLKMPLEKFLLTIQDYGNISSACIPVGLADAMMSGRLKRGDRICIVGFGGGLVYAASVFEW